MKNFTLSIMSLLCTTAIAMDNTHYQFHQATPRHSHPIVDVINQHAVTDNTKIVILPKEFRAMAVEQDIAKKRLYCATNQSEEVIAFKKLFILDKEKEYDDITLNEIRCASNNQCLGTQIFNANNICIPIKPCVPSPFSFKDSVIIYFGGDYTVPAYRNQKINSTLTLHAFSAIKNDTIDLIKKNNFDNIVLLYGLTRANAGEDGGIDRTPSIVRAFKKFAEQVSTETFNKHTVKNSIVNHSQYQAFMPTFDPESTECIPLPDNKSIAGYGNVLVFPLDNTNATIDMIKITKETK